MFWCMRVVYTLAFFGAVFAAGTSAEEKFVVWHTENDPQTLDVLNQIKSGFEKTQPDVRVELVFAGWDDLYQKLAVALRSGDVPDLTQIEPFMAPYLHRAGQLTPLDDVLDPTALQDIYPAIRDLQLFDGKRYGIPTAWGISFYSYRRDMLPSVVPSSDKNTFAEYLAFIANAPSASPLLLPSNNLHVTLLFTELVANNGGQLFDASGRPQFTQPQVQEALAFWKQMYDRLPPNLRNSTYADNFGHYATGRAASMPGFFGRGTTLIGRQAPEQFRTPAIFSLYPHPVGPSGHTSFATLDCEPWVILKASRHPDLARRFLRYFYSPDNYLRYCRTVPLHMLPVFKSSTESKEYQSDATVTLWRPYYDYALRMMNENRVLPIFMSRQEDRNNASLFRLEGSHIILNMVRDVTTGGKSPQEATAAAMTKADSLLSKP